MLYEQHLEFFNNENKLLQILKICCNCYLEGIARVKSAKSLDDLRVICLWNDLKGELERSVPSLYFSHLINSALEDKSYFGDMINAHLAKQRQEFEIAELMNDLDVWRNFADEDKAKDVCVQVARKACAFPVKFTEEVVPRVVLDVTKVIITPKEVHSLNAYRLVKQALYSREINGNEISTFLGERHANRISFVDDFGKEGSIFFEDMEEFSLQSRLYFHDVSDKVVLVIGRHNEGGKWQVGLRSHEELMKRIQHGQLNMNWHTSFLGLSSVENEYIFFNGEAKK